MSNHPEPPTDYAMALDSFRDLVEQNAALRAENERLRGALQTVKDESDDQWAVDVATAALGNA